MSCSHEKISKMMKYIQNYKINNGAGYVADKIFPVVRVRSEAFTYRIINNNNELKRVNSYAGCRSNIHELPPRESILVNGRTEEHALKQAVKYCEKDETCDGDIVLHTEADALEDLADKLMLEKETAALALLDPANFAANRKVDYTGSEFNIAGGTKGAKEIKRIMCDTPVRYNSAVISADVACRILFDPELLGNVDNRGVATIEQMANFLGLDNVYIADAWTDLAQWGQAQDLDRLGKNFIFLFHKSGSMSERGISKKATFGFEAMHIQQRYASLYNAAGGEGMFVRMYNDPEQGLYGTDFVVSGYEHDYVVTDYDLGYMLTNVVDTSVMYENY